MISTLTIPLVDGLTDVIVGSSNKDLRILHNVGTKTKPLFTLLNCEAAPTGGGGCEDADPQYSNTSVNIFYGFVPVPFAELTFADIDNDNDLDLLVLHSRIYLTHMPRSDMMCAMHSDPMVSDLFVQLSIHGQPEQRRVVISAEGTTRLAHSITRTYAHTCNLCHIETLPLRSAPCRWRRIGTR